VLALEQAMRQDPATQILAHAPIADDATAVPFRR
jgi:hypothetical protein